MNKTLIIIRHAHRSKEPGREIDNGLSEKGQLQSLRVYKYFQEQFSDADPVIASSPKKRCIETMLPFVNKDQSKIKTLTCLDEGDPLELKIDQFIQWWNDVRSELTIICSHGDWIPLCIEHLINERIKLKKGGYARFQSNSEKIKLVEIIQKF